MGSFEYLIALVSVIAGLGITRTLSGIARLVDYRSQIVFSWIPIVWTINVLLWLVAFWWFTFLLSGLEVWSPWLHIFVLVYAGVIFFLLALLHPESIGAGFDMFEHFLKNRKMFFGALIVTATIDVLDTFIKNHLGLPAPDPYIYCTFLLLWIAIGAVALYSAHRAIHAASALIFLVILTMWISLMITGLLDNSSTT